jgi:hypothetical protein
VFLNNRFTDLSQKGITDDSISVTRVVVIDAFFETADARLSHYVSCKPTGT